MGTLIILHTVQVTKKVSLLLGWYIEAKNAASSELVFVINKYGSVSVVYLYNTKQ